MQALGTSAMTYGYTHVLNSPSLHIDAHFQGVGRERKSAELRMLAGRDEISYALPLRQAERHKRTFNVAAYCVAGINIKDLVIGCYVRLAYPSSTWQSHLHGYKLNCEQAASKQCGENA